MTIEEFFSSYNGEAACISIEQYCEEERYDYYAIPDWIKSEEELKEFLAEYNPQLYTPSCLFMEPWWNDIKDREVQRWNIIGGSGYPMELTIKVAES